MMDDVNKMIALVHSCQLMEVFNKSAQLEYQRIFELDWSMLAGKPPTTDQIEKFNL